MATCAPSWLQCSPSLFSSLYFQFNGRAVLIQLRITSQSVSQLNDHDQIMIIFVCANSSTSTTAKAMCQGIPGWKQSGEGRNFSELEQISNMKLSHVILLQGSPSSSDHFSVSSLYFSSSFKWRLVNHCQVNTSVQINASSFRL